MTLTATTPLAAAEAFEHRRHRVLPLVLGLASAVVGAGLFVAPPAVAVDHVWEWGAPTALSSPSLDAYGPAAVIAANGSRAGVLWIEYDGSSNRARFAASPDGGSAWDDSTALSTASQNADYPDLAMSGNGLNLAAVWRRYNGSHWIVQGSGSDDGGLTWASAADLSAAGATTYFPSVALSAAATRRIAVWHQQGSPNVVQAAVGDDSANWGAATNLSAGSGNATGASAAISADGQQVATLWNKLLSSPSQLQSATSPDGGATWNATQTFPAAPGGPSGQSVVMSESGWTVASAWAANDGTDQRVLVRTSDDSGTTWNAIQTLSPAGVQATSPKIAVSADGSTLAVTWSVGNSGVYTTQVSVSSDGGHTWGAPIDLGAGARAETQSAPLVSGDGGRQAVVWSDFDGSQYSIKMVASFDAGATWGDPVMVSESAANYAAPSAAMARDGSRVLVTYTTSGGIGSVIARSATVGTVPAPPAPAPAPIVASAPRDPMATAGDRSAEVAWSAPASSGSFPVSHYLAMSTPGAHTCLVAAPALTCDVRGLTNGTAYTFTVKALTGAGWSASSEPSNAVVPRAAAGPSIVITGSRDGNRITVTGSTTGFGIGAILNPWVRLAGQSTFSQGSAQVLVSMDGTFQWGRASGKKASVYMQTPDGAVRSNTVNIAAR